MWERTLQDLIRGLRANKKDEAKFIAQAVDEIRREVKTKDMELKAAAVLKLTYLDMLGYDMSWASFHVVEVMSSPKFHLKAIGYLGAVQSFKQDTDVLMLTTNLIKKDLASTPLEIALSLNGLSHIVTPELGRDLALDLIAMLNHSRAYIRKRAVLALFRVFEKYPESLPHALPRLSEKLDDPDPGVVSATVNVLCELVRRNPPDYLRLAPQLFNILTETSNNWMLIKVIKLFGVLTPYEPRLVRKLLGPITKLIETTSAISLLYECVHTCIIGGMLQGPSGDNLASICVGKLASFLEDSDQNLKYIALLAMVKIVPSHPHLVAQYQEVIISSINDSDISIRMRALDLVSSMVNHHNLQSIVQQLLTHLVQSNSSSSAPTAVESLTSHSSADGGMRTAPAEKLTPAYRLEVSRRILAMCSQSTYEYVTDFEWYLSVLVDLAYVAAVDIGKEIRDQLLDVVVRVRAVRRYSVKLMLRLLNDDTFIVNAGEVGSCSEVLLAAAWICGEYCSEVIDPPRLLSCLLQPGVANLSPDIIIVYIQNALKVFGSWAADLASDWNDSRLNEVKSTVELMVAVMGTYASKPDIEVQERAANALQLFAFIRADLGNYKPKPPPSGVDDGGGFAAPDPEELSFPKSLLLLRPLNTLFDLNPVAAAAQSSVPKPDGLDLDTWIIPPPRNARLEEETKEKTGKGKGSKGKERAEGEGKVKSGKKRQKRNDVLAGPVEPNETPESRAERERLKQEREERMRDDPYYITDKLQPKSQRTYSATHAEVDAIPIVELDDMPDVPTLASQSPRWPSEQAPPAQPMFVDRGGEMPERAVTGQPKLAGQSKSQPEVSLLSPMPARFQPYDVDIDRASTPEPIKVTRVKKKGTGKKKKSAAPDDIQ